MLIVLLGFGEKSVEVLRGRKFGSVRGEPVVAKLMLFEKVMVPPDPLLAVIIAVSKLAPSTTDVALSMEEEVK